jgi:hypothetical protein
MSRPSWRAICFFGTPFNHSLRISFTSSIVTSRNAIAALRVEGASWLLGHPDGGNSSPLPAPSAP